MKRWNHLKGSVIVSGGVDVKSQMTASKKGLYFSGNHKAFQTFLVGKAESARWNVSLVDINMGQRYDCCFKNMMYIGRAEGARDETFLMLPHDLQVSKRHCKIYDAGRRLAIEDLDSTNHTFVNGRRCDNPVWLDKGCTVKIGSTCLKVIAAVYGGGR